MAQEGQGGAELGADGVVLVGSPGASFVEAVLAASELSAEMPAGVGAAGGAGGAADPEARGRLLPRSILAAPWLVSSSL